MGADRKWRGRRGRQKKTLWCQRLRRRSADDWRRLGSARRSNGPAGAEAPPTKGGASRAGGGADSRNNSNNSNNRGARKPGRRFVCYARRRSALLCRRAVFCFVFFSSFFGFFRLLLSALAFIASFFLSLASFMGVVLDFGALRRVAFQGRPTSSRGSIGLQRVR